MGRKAHVWAAVSQNEDRPHEVELRVDGTAVVFSGAGSHGAIFQVDNPEAIESLGYAMVLAAAMAKHHGMLDWIGEQKQA
jgi:hypothetical protein